MTLLKKEKKFKGQMLYHRRISMGLNLKDVALKIGRTMNAVHQWERGKCKPNPKSMFQLAKALKVKPEYFFQNKPDNGNS